MSKETERKDPNAFKGVDAGAIRRAAQGPAGPVRGSHWRRGRAAAQARARRRGAATATRP